MSGDEEEEERKSAPSSEVEDRLSIGRLSVAVMDAESLAPIFFSALFLGIILALGYVLSSFLADAVISFILLGLFRKPYLYFLRRVKNRWVASGITTGIVVVALLMPLFGFLYAVTVEATIAFDKLSY
jgi:predicted PurR-regulated permease PerM